MKKVIANCWFAVLLLKTTDFRFTDHNLRHQIFLPIWPNAVLQIFPNAVVSNVEWNEWPYLSSTLHIKTSFQNDVTLFAHEAGNCYHCKRECTSRTSWLTLSNEIFRLDNSSLKWNCGWSSSMSHQFQLLVSGLLTLLWLALVN